jgi:hypothetical protein
MGELYGTAIGKCRKFALEVTDGTRERAVARRLVLAAVRNHHHEQAYWPTQAAIALRIDIRLYVVGHAQPVDAQPALGRLRPGPPNGAVFERRPPVAIPKLNDPSSRPVGQRCATLRPDNIRQFFDI